MLPVLTKRSSTEQAGQAVKAITHNPTHHCRVLCAACRHGDSLAAGWLQVMELLVVLYRQGVLPENFTRALQGDGEVRR